MSVGVAPGLGSPKRGEISTHTHIVSTAFSTIPNFGDLARGISTKNEFLCLYVLL